MKEQNRSTPRKTRKPVIIECAESVLDSWCDIIAECDELEHLVAGVGALHVLGNTACQSAEL